METKYNKTGIIQAYKNSKKLQTKAVIKLNKETSHIHKKDRDVLDTISSKDLRLYAKYKEHKFRLKLAKSKIINEIASQNKGEVIFKTKKSIGGATLVSLRRGAGELIVFTKTKDLIDYVLDATSKSPKNFRFTLVTRIQNYALDVLENLYKANEILVVKNDLTKKTQRLAFQKRAITSLNLLLYLCEISYKHSCILEKQFIQIMKLGTIAETLIYNWYEKDSQRFN